MLDKMWLIWKEPKSRRRYKIGTLSYQNDCYYFEYVNPELDDAINVGFRYFPGFNDLSQKYESKQLFANIQTRLPNTSRPDYLQILNAYNLDTDSTKLDILKATKGKLLTDNYEFVPVFDSNKVELDVSGTRYCSDVEQCKKILNINDQLLLEIDPSNEYDKNAIKVYVKLIFNK